VLASPLLLAKLLPAGKRAVWFADVQTQVQLQPVTLPQSVLARMLTSPLVLAALLLLAALRLRTSPW